MSLTSGKLPQAGDPRGLYIFDLACWMYRYFRTVQGRAAYAFIEMVDKIIRDQQPGAIAICADLPFPTFRADLFPKVVGGGGYKGHREPPDPTLLERMRWARQMVRDVYGIPVFAVRGFEADDLIAALVHRGRAEGMHPVIVGLDKDLMQLVDETTVMWDGKKVVTGPAEVLKKFGVRPEQLRDYLAICGDTADNIPGVRGMGPAAAAELLQTFGTLETALAHAASNELADHADPAKLFKKRPKFRGMLNDSRANAELSIKLATLAIDAPLQHTIDDCRRPL